MSMHPAVWARLTDDEKRIAAYSGAVEAGRDWRLQRVADLTGVDAWKLEEDVECDRGWETHDKGYLHQLIVGVANVREADAADAEWAAANPCICDSLGHETGPEPPPSSSLVAVGGWRAPSWAPYMFTHRPGCPRYFMVLRSFPEVTASRGGVRFAAGGTP